MNEKNNEIQMELGLRVRETRKRAGLTMKGLAEKVGVSYLTIHRVESGKVSPSVSLLSDISQCLNQPIQKFFAENPGRCIFIKSEEQAELASENLYVRLIIPKGIINDNITLSLGKAKTGEFVGSHRTQGFELSYVIRGRCLFKHGKRAIEMKPGDVVYFDGQVLHSVVALEPLEFLLIHFRSEV